MCNRHIAVILFLFLTVLWNNSSFAGILSIAGTVVDAENGEPVQEAVVVFEWHITKGIIGMTYTDTYKAVETVTDKDGRFSVPRVINPMVSKPYFVIYKKGYYCWRAEWSPMTDTKRNNFKLHNNLTYEMDRYIPGMYLHMYSKASCYTGITENTPLLDEAISWEHKQVTKEQRLYQKKLDNLPSEERQKTKITSDILRSDYQTRTKAIKIADEIKKRLWHEVREELYLTPEKEEIEPHPTEPISAEQRTFRMINTTPWYRGQLIGDRLNPQSQKMNQ